MTQSDALATSLNALQQSIDQLNTTISGTNDQLASLSNKVGGLAVLSAQQGAEISHLKEQVKEIDNSVMSTGVKLSSAIENPTGKMAALMAAAFSKPLALDPKWEAIRAQAGAGPNAPLLIGLSPQWYEGLEGLEYFRWNKNFPNNNVQQAPYEPDGG